jgi:hypothetical protein
VGWGSRSLRGFVWVKVKEEGERRMIGTHANGTTLGTPSVIVGPYPDPDSYPSICRSHPHPDLRPRHGLGRCNLLALFVLKSQE